MHMTCGNLDENDKAQVTHGIIDENEKVFMQFTD